MKRLSLAQMALLLFCLTAAAEDCLLSITIPSDDPEKLVRAFCRADGYGMLASGGYWPLVQKFTVWDNGPGWDMSWVVSSFKTVTKKNNDDTAEIEVTYDVVGSLDANRWYDDGWSLDRSKGGVKRVVYRVERSDGQWKIVGPQLPPHLCAAYAITFIGSRCGMYDCKEDPTLIALRRVIQRPDYSFEPEP